MYTSPTAGTNIVGGSHIAGNYYTNDAGTGWSDTYANSFYSSYRFLSESAADAGYFAFNDATISQFVTETNYLTDIYPLIADLQITPSPGFTAPPELKLIDSGMPKAPTDIFVAESKFQLSEGEEIKSTRYVDQNNLTAITTHGLYYVDPINSVVSQIGSQTGNGISLTSICNNKSVTWSSSGNLVIWNNTPTNQSGVYVMMGVTDFTFESLHTNDETVVAVEKISNSNTVNLWIFDINGNYITKI